MNDEEFEAAVRKHEAETAAAIAREIEMGRIKKRRRGESRRGEGDAGCRARVGPYSSSHGEEMMPVLVVRLE